MECPVCLDLKDKREIHCSSVSETHSICLGCFLSIAKQTSIGETSFYDDPNVFGLKCPCECDAAISLGMIFSIFMSER